MIYVISDIHGCFDEFNALLDKAGFDREKDELIIAGDIVDRGKDSLKMLRLLENPPRNYLFLMGNHDYDFLSYCETIVRRFDSRRDKNIGFDEFCNDGILTYIEDYYGTVADLIIDCNADIGDFRKWQKCFSKLPYFVEREVNGRKYIIVHAGYIDESEYQDLCRSRLLSKGLRSDIKMFYIWAREEGVQFGGKDDTTIVFGHTPTIIEGEIFSNGGKVFVLKKPSKFQKGKIQRFINIDCGCVYRKYDENANLALLRLDDEKVFYLYERDEDETIGKAKESGEVTGVEGWMSADEFGTYMEND